MGLFTDQPDQSTPQSPANLWQAPGGAPAQPPSSPAMPPGGPPGSLSTQGMPGPSDQAMAALQMHSSGLHPTTLQHIGAALHGMGSAMLGQPHQIDPPGAMPMLHGGTMQQVGQFLANAARQQGQMGMANANTINRLG
jgi:hypothetical protein